MPKSAANAFVPCSPCCVMNMNKPHPGSSRRSIKIFLKDDDEDDVEDSDIDISNRDWRAFRAQLVMQGSDSSASDSIESSSTTPDSSIVGRTTESSSSTPDLAEDTSNMNMIYEDDLDGIGSLFTDEQTPMNTDNFTPLQPSQWAYDAGHVIEKGAVILGGVEQQFGFGLRQQYFHKVVCLVLDHDETFTKGIILNRPTDLLLVDEDDEKWRIWFGGDVQNLNHPMPEIVCMHTMKGRDPLVDEVSTTVMKDIQYCSFKQAKMLVKEKKAQTSDFWCFAGYAGWGPNQLMGELDRKSWYMCATDSQTLLKELAKKSAYTDPRDAGLDTWEMLMKMIGRGDTADECSGDFEDLMLKEWARENLLSMEAGGNAGIRLQPEEVASTKMDLVQGDTIDDLMKQTVGSVNASGVGVGTLLRASSAERSPFLLEDQEFHKSIILLIAEDENTSVGLIMNQPSTKGLEVELVDRNTNEKRDVYLPVRFGGQYAMRGQANIVWLYNSETLREAEIGKNVGSKDGIWQCSQDEAISAISAGLAKPTDFLIVSGLSVWIKGERGVKDGLRGEVKKGKFEVIDNNEVGYVWNALKKQERLTQLNFVKNLNAGKEAWNAGGDEKHKEEDEIPVTGGIGEGFDEEDDKMVFKSDVKVAKLSDDALRSWVATFLLGAPSLGA